VVGKSSFWFVVACHARFFADRYQSVFGIVGFELSAGRVSLEVVADHFLAEETMNQILEETEKISQNFDIRRIVVAVDLSKPSKKTAAYAVAFAKSFGASRH
jgi:hypothetical protein